MRDLPDFAGHFGQVLILAEDQCHIELPVPRHPHHIQTEPQIDPLLLSHRNAVRCATLILDDLGLVAQRSGDHGDPGSVQGGPAMGPAVEPQRRLFGRRNTRVETDAGKSPPLGSADSIGKLPRVAVGVVVTEGGLGVPEQVLAVEEGDGALDLWLSWHDAHTQITPPGPCGKSGGEQFGLSMGAAVSTVKGDRTVCSVDDSGSAADWNGQSS